MDSYGGGSIDAWDTDVCRDDDEAEKSMIYVCVCAKAVPG